MTTLIGQEAPDFTTTAVLGDGTIETQYRLYNAIKGSYALLFFYPLDFTFVCPTELVALNKYFETFKNRNITIITVSVDSAYTHRAWRNTPLTEGGIGPVKYTMVADVKHEIARMYGVESQEGVAFRGAFLIDRQGKVRIQVINDLPIGRSIEELLRLFDALQFYEAHGEVCPADWKKGDPGMQASAEGVSNFFITDDQSN